MMRAIYSGVTGLRNHQIRMDVIGNNIANINTAGFKTSRVVFEDLYSQTIKPAAAPGNDLGGTNPRQVGLGMTIATIDIMHTRTSSQYTGVPFDLSIEGDGFFVVRDGNQEYYTRAGNFYTDGDNNLVNGNGLIVQSYNSVTKTRADIKIPDNYNSISIDRNGNILGINDATGVKEVIGQICIANFNNQNALEKVGQNLYQANLNTGNPKICNPGENGTALLNAGSLEMSNVDLASEFTDMIITQRGFQANSRIITTTDQMLEELVNLKR